MIVDFLPTEKKLFNQQQNSFDLLLFHVMDDRQKTETILQVNN